MEEFLKNFCEMLGTGETVCADTFLSKIKEWDSMTVVDFVAMTDIKYKKTVSLDELDKAETVSDLYRLISD